MDVDERRSLILEAAADERPQTVAGRRVVEVVEQPVIGVVRPRVDQLDGGDFGRDLVLPFEPEAGRGADEDRARLPVMALGLACVVGSEKRLPPFARLAQAMPADISAVGLGGDPSQPVAGIVRAGLAKPFGGRGRHGEVADVHDKSPSSIVWCRRYGAMAPRKRSASCGRTRKCRYSPHSRDADRQSEGAASTSSPWRSANRTSSMSEPTPS